MWYARLRYALRHATKALLLVDMQCGYRFIKTELWMIK